MSHVAEENIDPAAAGNPYLSRLTQVVNGQRYVGPVSGVVNTDTETAIQHWLNSP
jgi:hypothetical protein